MIIHKAKLTPCCILPFPAVFTGITSFDSKAGEKNWDYWKQSCKRAKRWWGQRGREKTLRRNATYKVQEAAADLMMSVGLGLEQLLHHGQEVFVDSQNFLDVWEQNLREEPDTNQIKSAFFCGKWPFTGTFLRFLFSLMLEFQTEIFQQRMKKKEKDLLREKTHLWDIVLSPVLCHFYGDIKRQSKTPGTAKDRLIQLSGDITVCCYLTSSWPGLSRAPISTQCS